MEQRITDLTKDEIAKLFPVKLFSYSSQWIGIYENERDLILSVLKEEILRIEHFGSTSIPNLTAKVTIDILIESLMKKTSVVK